MAQTYISHVHHRNRTAGKSQWTITEVEERQVFAHAQARGWLRPAVGWGLHLFSDKPEWLGIDADRTTKLFIAKFVASLTPVQWHGYPTDHRRGAREIPDELVLRSWMDSGYFTPGKIRKLGKGQQCVL